MERKRLLAYSCGPEERERYARYSAPCRKTRSSPAATTA